MKEVIKQEVDDYKRILASKINDLQNLRNGVLKVEAEINMLNGAIQACEKLLNSDDSGKADRK